VRSGRALTCARALVLRRTNPDAIRPHDIVHLAKVAPDGVTFGSRRANPGDESQKARADRTSCFRVAEDPR
jgi:hypothetical protein